MLNNILHLENVKKIDKKQQKEITGGGVTFNTTLAPCSRCCMSCRNRGYDSGSYHTGECYCFNYIR